VIGWGVYIIEGPNIVWITRLTLVAVLIRGLVSTIYSIKEKGRLRGVCNRSLDHFSLGCRYHRLVLAIEGRMIGALERWEWWMS